MIFEVQGINTEVCFFEETWVSV